jgi:hypothetical protein
MWFYFKTLSCDGGQYGLPTQSSKLGGSPKPEACKIVHGHIQWVVPQVRRACEKKVI